MRIAVKKGRDVQWCERPATPLAPDRVRVRVAACGICGTDLQEDPHQEDRETGFGHEIAGTIVEIGSAVTNVRNGQRVVLESATACGKCGNCRNGRQELCTDIQSFFFLDSFGFADEMTAPGVSAILCEDLAPEAACLSEPLGVAIDLVRLGDIRLDSNVLVMGQGPIGLMVTALVRRMGARRVFASQRRRRTARVELARRFGADDVIHPETTPLADIDFGCVIDRVLVTTPPPTLNAAFEVAGKGGIVAFIGIAHGTDAFCRFDANAFHFKKLQLRASFASPALYTPLALQYLRERVVDGPALISHRFSLDALAQAMATARSSPDAVKVVVTP
ncbi:MAG: alcohol dehydrogenase catalytic domain-containing protein [Kiritimatiellaeota bacterium]|nr:alcohol dehydrogenase catalytic domain-containing protein [Kiritimatiellota bacterium]